MKKLERTLTEIAVSLLFVILAMVLFGVHGKKPEEKPPKEAVMKRETDREMRGVWVASVENLDYHAHRFGTGIAGPGRRCYGRSGKDGI